ncbi:DUF998 domain-containing protein [Microbacterium sp. W1N]|uniref:DUF998 domain-containing protein n=1 Tax=Microbacterium festucae TaxID=2977531 RepID=UPI0021BEBE39|nr:DUF998 domain-containing protein [Microbacterium festucae]MCT9821091.1 DUF998 domain-containing protein [Microbacterium festucae]
MTLGVGMGWGRLGQSLAHNGNAWRRVTVAVRLTPEQRVHAAAPIVAFDGARLRPDGVVLPGLGVVRHRHPAVLSPWLRTVRLLTLSDGSHAVEYTARSLASVVTPVRLIMLAMTVLASAVSLSALTTRDRFWWMHAFSRLGVFDDLSSLAFNGGLIVSGIVSGLFATRLWLDLARLSRRGARPAAAVVVPALCMLASVGIVSVGLFTEYANKVVHDISAATLALAFAGMMITAPWMLKGLGRRPRLVTRICSTGLVVGITLHVLEIINLALFELVMFALFFLWLVTVSVAAHSRLHAHALARVGASQPAAPEPVIAVPQTPVIAVRHAAPRRIAPVRPISMAPRRVSAGRATRAVRVDRARPRVRRTVAPRPHRRELARRP